MHSNYVQLFCSRLKTVNYFNLRFKSYFFRYAIIAITINTVQIILLIEKNGQNRK